MCIHLKCMFMLYKATVLTFNRLGSGNFNFSGNTCIINNKITDFHCRFVERWNILRKLMGFLLPEPDYYTSTLLNIGKTAWSNQVLWSKHLYICWWTEFRSADYVFVCLKTDSRELQITFHRAYCYMQVQ